MQKEDQRPLSGKYQWDLGRITFYCFIVACISFFVHNASAGPNPEGIQVYQKNAHLLPEHRQKVAEDISRYHHADNIWDVLRDEFSLPHYEDHPAVQDKIEWYMNNQDFLLRSANRAAPYLYYIMQQIKKRHLPAELALLPIIESGYNPLSSSPVGAAGIWQLMPRTAAGLGVRQDWWYDGRRDVIMSTRAALNHLAYLESFFEGNWLLALAAYDTGEGNVVSAIKKNIRYGYDTDFWSLPVATETKNYVPSLLALAIIISNPDRYPIYFPPVRNAPYLAQVDLGKQINLKYAADLAGISYKKMIALNPAYNKRLLATKGPSKLILPIENVMQFTENLSRTPLSQPVTWVHYKVKSGDNIMLVAQKFKTTPGAIRKLNHLAKNSLRHGTTILIPNEQITAPNTPRVETSNTPIFIGKANSGAANIDIESNKTEPMIAGMQAKTINAYALHPGDTIYMVRNHDTLEHVATRFHINPQALRAANQLRGRKLTPGKQLIIPTHEAAPANNTPTKIQPGDTLYMVRKGDTIEKIANRFHTSAAAIRIANLVDDQTLQEGQRVVVPTHIRG